MADGNVSSAGIVVGGLDGVVYKVNLDGSLAWTFATAGQIRGGAALTRDGYIIIGSTDMYLYCLNSRDGVLIWKFFAAQEITSSAVIQDVSITFGTRQDASRPARLIALMRDASVRWEVNMSASVEGDVIEDPVTGVVYAATNDGKLVAVQPDGRQVWRYITGGSGGVCGDYSKQADEGASPTENRECSFAELGAHGTTSPCLVNGILVTTSQNKMVYGIKLDGTLAWKHPTSKRIRAPPRCMSSRDKFGVERSRIIVASNDRHLYSLSEAV